MYKIQGKISGTAPLLFGKMSDDTVKTLSGEGGGGRRYTPAERLAEVAQRYYWDEEGIYLPGWSFKKCLLDGTKKGGIKEGKASAASFFAATVFPDAKLRFNKKEPDGVYEAQGKRPPRTGGAVIIRYPMMEADWEVSFTLTVVDDRRAEADIRRGLEEAGLLVGLGPWRPEFGRFIVSEWERVS